MESDPEFKTPKKTLFKSPGGSCESLVSTQSPCSSEASSATKLQTALTSFKGTVKSDRVSMFTRSLSEDIMKA